MSPAKTVKRTTAERMRSVQHLFLPRAKKLVLIRPRVPGDTYTEVGSNVWAALVKQKALDEGWQVTDLDANGASREQIEVAINAEKPTLVIHYDHGSNFTLWGQESNALEPGLDDENIAIVSGRMLSTVSCLSATGLGPLAITDGVTSYLGYTDLHTFWTGSYAARFGLAANAANFALLECKTAQEAFDIGWAAYDLLFTQLLAEGGFAASTVAPTALHDRDCFALLGSPSATACPATFHCLSGPDMMTTYCRIGLPNLVLHCLSGHPDMPTLVCRVGLPNLVTQCAYGNPDRMIAVCREASGYGCVRTRPRRVHRRPATAHPRCV